MSPVTGKERRRAPARAHALSATPPRPRGARTARWLPNGRSLAVGAALVALAGGAYAVARETSLFAVKRIEVRGAPPALAARISSALAPVEGTSLVSFGRGAADRRLAGFPEIASVSYDRDFPHTLRVHVTVEQPVAVLRRGPDAWLVSSTGRVLSLLQPGSYPPLPRIWLAAETGITVGGTVETGRAALVATALTRQRLPNRVLAIRDEGGAGGIVLQLAGAREVRLGDSTNLAVKLAVAAAILPQAPDANYVDVSVPTRGVAGYQPAVPSYDNAQVSGQG